MVTINIYEGTAKQAENSSQSAEAPAPQASSITQATQGKEIQSSSAPAPENTNIDLGNQNLTGTAPAPSMFNGEVLAESVPSPSSSDNMQEFANATAPEPSMLVEAASADASMPAPSEQVKAEENAGNTPAPSSSPGEQSGEKNNKEELSKKK